MNQLPSKVILAGAGPGHPDLITMKAVKALQQADIVLVDRLVNESITQQYAPQAVIITVGKQSGSSDSMDQKTISALMCKHALEGRQVVRLKGGDISFFSNIRHELDMLAEHHIPFELIPGVTAASGVSATAGVPLTARGLAKGVRFITWHNNESISVADWINMAHTNDTLVFYMSGRSCFQVARLLMQYGMQKTMPVMLVENATMPNEKIRTSTLMGCENEWENQNIQSPAMLVIGENVSLHNEYVMHQIKSNDEQILNNNWHPLLPQRLQQQLVVHAIKQES